jgi:cobaltochelatase CobS
MNHTLDQLKQHVSGMTHRQLVRYLKALKGGSVGFDYMKESKGVMCAAVKTRLNLLGESVASDKFNEAFPQGLYETGVRRGARREERREASAAASVNASATDSVADSATDGDDDDIARLVEALKRRKNCDPEMVRKIVKEELKSVPPLVIEVRRDGDLIGKLEGRQHAKLPTLLKACSARMADGYPVNVWVSGPSGSGKTHAAISVSKALSVPFHYNGALAMSHEVTGYQDAGGKYHPTAFRNAYQHGGVYLFDEVDGCDSNAPLMALNAALANGIASFPDGMIERHKDSWIIAGANTWGLGATADYVGRIKLDAAFLARFPVKVHMDYDEELERQICGNADFAVTVQQARFKARQSGLKLMITPRDSMAGAALIAAGFSKSEAIAMTYGATLTPEQCKTLGA